MTNAESTLCSVALENIPKPQPQKDATSLKEEEKFFDRNFTQKLVYVWEHRKRFLYYLSISILAILFCVYFCLAIGHDVKKALPLIIGTVIIATGIAYFKVISPCIIDRLNFQYVYDCSTKLWEKRLIRLVTYGVILIALIIFLILDTSDNRYRLVPVGGIAAIICLAVLLSVNPAKIKWRPVIWGFGIQFLVALFALRLSIGLALFQWLSDLLVAFLKYTDHGTKFVYGFVADPPNICRMHGVFAFTVLPVIIYFGSIVALLYYLGIIQFVLRRVAWLVQLTIGTTAAESLYVVGCLILGQSEAPILITPYLSKLTKSELNTIMTAGFSCIAGTVFAAYVALGACPLYILSSCLMSAPASIAISKILLPEMEESQLKSLADLKLPKSKERNIIEAISSGACQVIGVVASILANLIVFTALLAFIDDSVEYLADLVGLNFDFQTLLGYLFFPFAFVMGASDRPEWDHKMNETMVVARLLGTKTVMNEFIAYEKMGEFISKGELSGRARMIATYALCSFANFSSIGVQLGVIGSLCPEKKGQIAKTALRALLGGCLCCIITSCVAGIILEKPLLCYPENFNRNCTSIG